MEGERDPLSPILDRLSALEKRLAALEGKPSPAAAPAPPPPKPPAPSALPPSTEARPLPLSEPKARPLRLPGLTAAERFGRAERFIGLKILGAVGALLLLVAAAFFLKLAFDRGWIGPPVRIAMGTIAGLALFAGAEVLVRRKLRPLAAAVAGAGIAILTLTNYAAQTADYGITSFALAFALGCAITVLGFAWSVARSLQAALVLAEIGGFLTPVLISRPSASPWGITLYLAALSAASGGLAALRRWRWPTALAFAGSLAIFAAWIVTSMRRAEEAGATAAIGICAWILGGVFIGDIGLRALRGGRAARGEAVLLFAAVSIFGSLGVRFLEEERLRLLGVLLLGAAAALGLVAALGRSDAKPARTVALVLGIATLTGAIPCFFERAMLGIVWAIEAAALSLLERRTRALLPVLGAFVVHALVAGRIAAFGELPENAEFVWSERATVCAFEAVALLATALSMRGEPGVRAVAARLALAASQLFVAILLLVTVPSPRVTPAWCAQALACAWLARRTKQGDYALLSVAILVVAAFRFLGRGEDALAVTALPFLNRRALSIALAAATALVLAPFADEKRSLGSAGGRVARFAAVALLALVVASELSFLVSRPYGAELRLFDLDLSLAGAPFRLLNARFVFLASAAATLALGTRLPWLGGGGTNAATVIQTLAAHLLIWLALSLEAVGWADPAASAAPGADPLAWRASNVQTALSIAMAAVPTLALVLGFRRSAVHRWFGIVGLLVTVVKVLVVDLADVALEWRILSFLGLGVLLLAGAFAYARAMRRAAAPSP